MKSFLLGILFGLFLGWLTVPVVKADYHFQPSNDAEELSHPQAYKWYLTRMLLHIESVDDKLTQLNDSMKAVKDKLHA